jgi:hypothetical protein
MLDELKLFGDITAPDSRMANLWVRSPAPDPFSPLTLETYYERIAQEILPHHLPDDVRQKFETARNLLLYSWFCYRFFPVATLHLYATLESGLRHALHDVQNERSLGLKRLLVSAREKGLLLSARFRDRSPMPLAPPVPITAPPEAFLEMIEKLIPYMRNELAHGAELLWPDHTHTLRIVRDALIQLFPAPPSPSGD